MKTLFITLVLISNTALSIGHVKRSLASIRVEHAKELMGPGYKKSIVAKFEHHKDLKQNIMETVKNRLPESHQGRSKTIAKAIIEQAALHSLDPYFVMAVIAGESSFNPKAVGPVGEIGLMQIRPTTAEWMAKAMKMKWRGTKSLYDPVTNIQIGTAYLAYLRAKFEGHGQLYLAAYNMGPKSVRKALVRKVYPKDYPMHVMKRYLAFYKEMHENI